MVVFGFGRQHAVDIYGYVYYAFCGSFEVVAEYSSLFCMLLGRLSVRYLKHKHNYHTQNTLNKILIKYLFVIMSNCN